MPDSRLHRSQSSADLAVCEDRLREPSQAVAVDLTREGASGGVAQLNLGDDTHVVGAARDVLADAEDGSERRGSVKGISHRQRKEGKPNDARVPSDIPPLVHD
jgi:hypothetical protein